MRSTLTRIVPRSAGFGNVVLASVTSCNILGTFCTGHIPPCQDQVLIQAARNQSPLLHDLAPSAQLFLESARGAEDVLVLSDQAIAFADGLLQVGFAG
jgi:hypothetical protein